MQHVIQASQNSKSDNKYFKSTVPIFLKNFRIFTISIQHIYYIYYKKLNNIFDFKYMHICDKEI